MTCAMLLPKLSQCRWSLCACTASVAGSGSAASAAPAALPAQHSAEAPTAFAGSAAISAAKARPGF
eukprot:2720037-Alexandrium_andersonii.AAC.1